jgi:hypothetical protein
MSNPHAQSATMSNPHAQSATMSNPHAQYKHPLINQTHIFEDNDSDEGNGVYRPLALGVTMYIFCVVGVVGNGVTCYVLFYNFRTKFWKTWFQIISVCDLLSCTILIPNEAISLLRVSFFKFKFGCLV